MIFDTNDRIPFFAFADREHGEDHEASLKAGYAVPKLMTFILIAPHGHKGDPMEFFADDWIEKKSGEARRGNYNQSWVSEFKAGLAAFREGKEIPRSGSPVILWERLLKSRREQLARKYPTVEDLAMVPDSSIGEIGMDGRVIRDMARADIQAKKDLSPVVKELADAKETVRRQEVRIEEMSVKMADLASRLDSLGEKRGPGRPRKETEEA